MLQKNVGRLLLSLALTLSYVWTACQRQEMEAKAPRNPKIDVRELQVNKPIFAETFSQSRQPIKQ